MVRLATQHDVGPVAMQMTLLGPETGWFNVGVGHDREALEHFVRARFLDANSVCYVWDAGDDDLRAFCGVTLTQLHLPPYMPTMFEWGWRGIPRHAAQCWDACRRWGRKRGAVLACRVSGRPGSNVRRITEQVTWEVL